MDRVRARSPYLGPNGATGKRTLDGSDCLLVRRRWSAHDQLGRVGPGLAQNAAKRSPRFGGNTRIDDHNIRRFAGGETERITSGPCHRDHVAKPHECIGQVREPMGIGGKQQDLRRAPAEVTDAPGPVALHANTPVPNKMRILIVALMR
jgi:hypothetical protein